MISSILATDMGLHFDYMKKLATLKQSFEADGNPAKWNGRQLEDAKVLVCSLLIKCADISNVVCVVACGISKNEGRLVPHLLPLCFHLVREHKWKILTRSDRHAAIQQH